MKKISSIILAGLGVFALASCSKEILQTPETPETPEVAKKEVTLTFTGKRPQFNTETRTEWDGTTIVWSDKDAIRVGYTYDGAWMGQTDEGTAMFYASDAVEIDASDAAIGTFTVPGTFNSPGPGEYAFYAYYPSSARAGSYNTAPDAPVVSVVVPALQTPLADSFDKTADLMIGTSEPEELDDLPEDPIGINWKRVVAHGYFTLKGLQGIEEGEIVQKIVLTAQEGANLAGGFKVSTEDGSFVANTDVSNEITISGQNLAFVADGDASNLPFWISVMPTTLTSLKVEVLTSKAEYTREITGISKTLKGNARNVLAINMSSVEREEIEEIPWVRTDIADITSEDVFVIVGENADGTFAMRNDNATNSGPAAYPVTVDEDQLAVAPIDEIQWTLVKSGDNYNFYPAGSTSTYLYCIANNNGLRIGKNETEPDSKNFVLDSSGYLKNVAQSRFVGIYNSTDWRSYTSINNNIKNQTFAFYVKNGSGSTTPPTPPTPEESFTTVAELNALATATETEVTGTLTDAIVSFVPDAKNAVIKDATGSVLFFKDGHGLLQGQTFSGDVTVTVKLYNGTAEIIACDAEFTGSQANVDPVTYTLDDLVGNLSTYQNAYSKIEDLEVTAVSGKNVTVKNGTKTYAVYSAAADATCAVGDIITVTGTICHHGSNDQIRAWKATDIVVTGNTGGGSTEEKTATFVFNTDAGLSALGIAKPAASAGTDLGDDAYTREDITLVATDGGTHTRVWNTSGKTDLRIYSNGTLTLSVDSGTISKIVFAGSAVNAFSTSAGSFDSGTWTGSAESVTFTATGTGKISTITVTYE
jgi:hypothetical protein